MNREMMFGRLIAIATVLGDRVADKGTPPINGKYLDKLGKEPAKTITKIHEDLMQYAHKFGSEEMALLDMFGEMMAQLNFDDFTNKPLDHTYLLGYYQQKVHMIVGYKEFYEILGWNYDKNRTMLNTYLKRAEEKGWPKDMAPKPIQVLASGPIWLRHQAEEYRDSRK